MIQPPGVVERGGGGSDVAVAHGGPGTLHEGAWIVGGAFQGQVDESVDGFLGGQPFEGRAQPGLLQCVRHRHQRVADLRDFEADEGGAVAALDGARRVVRQPIQGVRHGAEVPDRFPHGSPTRAAIAKCRVCRLGSPYFRHP